MYTIHGENRSYIYKNKLHEVEKLPFIYIKNKQNDIVTIIHYFHLKFIVHVDDNIDHIVAHSLLLAV